MNSTSIIAVAAVALLSACTVNNTTTHVAPPPDTAMTGSEQACVDYGFTPGTAAYQNCVAREHEARLHGRVARDYAVARLTVDAQDACSSYGLVTGTQAYNRCVAREVDERRYREGV
jgi:hypothetical protein